MTSLRLMLAGAIAVGVVFSPRPVQAWHEVGHMSTALIGYRKLDDAGKMKVIEILKKHPHYEIFLSSQAPADAQLDEWTVMRASIWPDWVKNPNKIIQDTEKSRKISSQYDRRDWHYVNLPIADFTGADEATKMQIEANMKHKNGRVLDVLPTLLAGLKEPEKAKALILGPDHLPMLNDAELKAICLCWVLHLTGDLHQPLHAAAFFAKDSLTGDRGGNSFKVHWQNSVVDLHTIWDGKFAWDSLQGADGSQYAAVDQLVRDKLDRIKLTGEEIGELKPETWAAESKKLAEQKAYMLNGVRIPGVIRGPDDHHQPHVSDIDPLPPGYGNIARRIAEKRVAMAGNRLAGTLTANLAGD